MPRYVPEGCTSYHTYRCIGPTNAVVTSIESGRYKVSSKSLVLLPWTAITTPTGSIIVPADVNTITSSTGPYRYITIEVTHSGGEKIAGEDEYILKPIIGLP